MQPVAAVLTVFSLVFTAICWFQLARACFAQGTLPGIVALLLPPLALLTLLPQWRRHWEVFALAAAALAFVSIATIL